MSDPRSSFCEHCGYGATCSGECLKPAPATLSQHRVAPPELSAAIDDALDLVELPPIRIPKELYDKLIKACERSGQIVQAEVRDMIKLGVTIVDNLPPLQPKHLSKISPAAAWPGVAKPQRFGSTLEERARQLYWDDTGPTGFVAQMISFYNLPPVQRDAWRAAAAERSL